MPAWEAYSFVFGPLMGFFVIGLFVVLLRWTFAPGKSLVTSPIRPSDPDDYGLLEVLCLVTQPNVGAEQLRQLTGAGIRANLIYTSAGLALMVWPADKQRAAAILNLR